MASKGAIGALNANALEKLRLSAERLAKATKVDPPEFQARRHGDPEFLRVTQLDALATWIEQIADAVTGETTAAKEAPLPEPEVVEPKPAPVEKAAPKGKKG